MRSTRLTTCAIALAAALSMPAFAQSTGSGTSSGSTTANDTAAGNINRGDNDRDFDWGLLGLLGLAGLLGLRKQPDGYRGDPTPTSVPR